MNNQLLLIKCPICGYRSQLASVSMEDLQICPACNYVAPFGEFVEDIDE